MIPADGVVRLVSYALYAPPFGVGEETYYVARTDCGDGIVAGWETCDDGNTLDGDCCSAQCDQEADGNPCSDGDVCTLEDRCQNGICASVGDADCVDGDACTRDHCDPTLGCIHDPSRWQECAHAAKSQILVKNSDDDGKDRLLWKWLQGDELSPAEFADSSQASYAVCIYAGNDAGLVAQAGVPAGTGWEPLGATRYRFKEATPDGLDKVILGGGATGRAKAIMMGRGASLPDIALPLEPPLVMQWRRENSSLCLESVFSADDVVKNNTELFKARNP
ncbi:MAG: hypothetical protein SF182_01605 [Deltaproteobacteria bacterium]|nr:hypothetical protein [Deltaproteobacteria bacterium]